MKQHVRVEMKNENKAYSAIKINSVYEKNGTLYVISELSGNYDNAGVPDTVSDEVDVEVNSKEDLPVKDIIQVPRTLAKEKLDDYKSKLKDAHCIYGKDIRSYKDQFLMCLQRFQMPDFDMLRKRMFTLNGAMWGMGVAATAVAGFFAVRQYGAQIQEKATQVFNRKFR